MGRKPRSQRRKKGGAMEGSSGGGGGSDGEDGDPMDRSSDGGRAETLSESFTVADAASVYSRNDGGGGDEGYDGFSLGGGEQSAEGVTQRRNGTKRALLRLIAALLIFSSARLPADSIFTFQTRTTTPCT
jgi:hypothetical protein